MRFSCGEKTFCLKRRFDRYTKGAVLICEDDGEELSVEYGDLDMLLGNVSAAAYENTCCIGQEQLLPGRELGVLLEDERSNLAQTGSGDFQLSKALQELEQKRKNAEKTRKELEQQRLSHIHQLEVNQQVLERGYRRTESAAGKAEYAAGYGAGAGKSAAAADGTGTDSLSDGLSAGTGAEERGSTGTVGMGAG